MARLQKEETCRLIREGCQQKSLLYRLHGWGLDEKIAPLQHFEEVYTTSHKMVRIYKARSHSAGW